jgi:hypothetical protein
MDSMVELFAATLGNKISQIRLKKQIREGVKALDRAINYLRSTDGEKLIRMIADELPEAAKKAYEDGRFSKEMIENCRKTAVIFPGKAMDSMYGFNKMVYDIGKERSEGEKS